MVVSRSHWRLPLIWARPCGRSLLGTGCVTNVATTSTVFGTLAIEMTFDFEKLSVSVTLFRHVGSDVAAFDLYDSKRPQAILHNYGAAHPVVANDESAIDHTSSFDLSKNRIQGNITVRESRDGIKTWQLRPSCQADAITRRLTFEVRFAPVLVFDVVEGDRFVLEACYITAMKYNHTGEYWVFDSRKEVKVHGISLLRILSELHEA